MHPGLSSITSVFCVLLAKFNGKLCFGSYYREDVRLRQADAMGDSEPYLAMVYFVPNEAKRLVLGVAHAFNIIVS